MARVLGVLGGMGPAATVAFLARVQALTPADGDADHIRIIMDLNPQVPDRNREPEAAETVLGQMAVALRDAGAEVLAMPCNTAHAQAAGIRSAGLPFIDMIAETAAAARATGATRIGVLATPGGEKLYVATLSAMGLQPVSMDASERERFLACVYGVKRGDLSPGQRQAMSGLANALIARGAEAVIGGCTEVPLLLSLSDVAVPFVDSAEVLAAACVKACLSDDGNG